jgi:hypothetical protein
LDGLLETEGSTCGLGSEAAFALTSALAVKPSEAVASDGRRVWLAGPVIA